MQGAGFEVNSFPNPEGNFIQKVLDFNPDLISLGVVFGKETPKGERVLCDVDGFDAIKMLKADKRTKNMPIIFLTNLGQKKDIERGLSLVAIDYLIMAQYTPSEVITIFSKYLKEYSPSSQQEK